MATLTYDPSYVHQYLVPFAAEGLKVHAFALLQKMSGRLWRVVASEPEERLFVLLSHIFQVYLSGLACASSEDEIQNRLEFLVRNQDLESLQRQISILERQGARYRVGRSWEEVLGRHFLLRSQGVPRTQEFKEKWEVKGAIFQNLHLLSEPTKHQLKGLMEHGVSTLVDDVCVPPEFAETIENSQKGFFCFLTLALAPKPIAASLALPMFEQVMLGLRADLSLFAEPTRTRLPAAWGIVPIDVAHCFEAYVQAQLFLEQGSQRALALDASTSPVFDHLVPSSEA